MSAPRRLSRADLALGAGVAVLALAAGAAGIGPDGPAEHRPDLGAVGLVVVLALAVAARRRVPWAALAATNVVASAWYLIGYHGRLVTLAPLIACYTVAAVRGWRWGTAGGLLTAAVTTVTVRVAFGAWFSDAVVNAIMLEVTIVALGAAVHSHRVSAANARLHAEHLAETRAEQARRQAAEQRLEIARELHDAFGHTMAAVSVQAGVAIHVMHRRPEQTAAALATIKQISDEGLAEVRILLGVLRGGDEPSSSPAGGLARLDGLLQVTRAAGVRADLRVTGPVSAVPPRVDLAAYRIVQESLTNVRRHAHATTVAVELAYRPTHLGIVVRDDGGGTRAVDAAPGHGISGMRARATALGGELTAAPHAAGGFEVRCTLPIPGRI